MNILKQNDIINKYVFYSDTCKYNDLIITPKSHIFIVYDRDTDPDTRYCWCIKSIKYKSLELWVKQTQLIILDDKQQESIKMLYG